MIGVIILLGVIALIAWATTWKPTVKVTPPVVEKTAEEEAIEALSQPGIVEQVIAPEPVVAPAAAKSATARAEAKAEISASGLALTAEQESTMVEAKEVGAKTTPEVLVKYAEYQKIVSGLPTPSTEEHWTGFYPTQATIDWLEAGGRPRR